MKIKLAVFLVFLKINFYFAIAAPSEPSQNKRVFSYISAVNYYHNKKYNEAIKLLLLEKNFSLKHPLMNEINLLLALCYYQTQNFNDALLYLNKLSQDGPLEDYIMYFKAMTLHHQNKFNESLTLFQTILNRHPRTIWKDDIIKNQFTINHKLKNHKTAITYYKKHNFYRKYPTEADSELHLKYANSNLETRNFKEGFNSLKNLMIRYPQTETFKLANEILIKKKQKLSPSELRLLVISQINKGIYKEAKNNLTTMEKNKIDIDDLNIRYYTATRNWEALINQISKDLKENSPPKTLFDLARAYSRSGNYSKARFYYKKVASDHSKNNLAPQSLFLASKLYSYEGNYSKAIETYRELYEKFPSNSLIPSTLWYKGWNYYLMQNFDEALLTWTKTSDMLDKNDPLISKLLYWRARIFLNQGDLKAASNIFKEIVQIYNFSYYSYQAQNRLIESTPSNKELIANIQEKTYSIVSKSPELSCKNIDLDDFKKNITSPEELFFSKAQELIKVGLDNYASLELLRIRNSTKDRNTLFSLSKIFNCIGDYNKSQYISRVNFSDKLEEELSENTIVYWKLAFPEGYSNIISKLSPHISFSPYLIYSLIRAESNFDPNALSFAKAIGLMQIIPPTGEQIAKKINDTTYNVNDLYDTKTNITFGTWYIQSLIDKFDGNTILAIPSYNAGPHNVKRWVQQFGSMDVDEFVEMIPFNETRNYVKGVIRNYGVYRTLYSNDKSILRLSQKLQFDRSKLRTPAESKNVEDWSFYKESEDLRPKILLKKFSMDKLSLVEYFSLNSFKNHIESRRLFRR